MTEISYEITIAAAAETVFSHLTEREGLLRWMGVAATSDPVPGGVVTWTHENGATMVGRFVEVDPPRRLVMSYGWADDLMGLPPESTTVEIDLTPVDDGTQVQLIHRDLPVDVAADHQHGWEHFFGTLRALLEQPA